MENKKSARLRSLLASGKTFVIASAPGGLYAQMMEKAGVDCFFVGSNIVMGTLMGIPDGVLSPTEMVWINRWIAHSTNVPVIADGDTGFGGHRRIQRMVEELITGGVSGVRIEDRTQASAPAWAEVESALAPLTECAARIRSAVETRNSLDPNFVVIAKTDALAVDPDDLEGAVARLKAYKQAGADVLHLHKPGTKSRVEQARSELDGPLIIGDPLGIPDLLTVEQHQSSGLAIAWYSDLLMRYQAVKSWDYLESIKTKGYQVYFDFVEEAKTHPFGSRSYQKQATDAVQAFEEIIWPKGS